MSKTAAPAASRETAMPGPVVLDVAGQTLDAEDIRRIRHPLTGGVILFARSYSSRKQLRELTAAIRKVRADVLICVDHEGGRVQRFKTDGFTHLPAMRKLGQLWENDVLAAIKAAQSCGYVLAAELRANGVDFSFTPVLDLDYGHSQVIGDRAFHHDPRVAAMLAGALNHGLLMAGMSNCGKHFPGHGFVAADSHVDVPVDERALEDILVRDAAPYDWTSPGLASVMPAHVIYPKVDKMPAGFSRYWLQDILRAKLGFTGAVFSDDLSMEGASVAGSVCEGTRVALHAGCDMVLVCNSPAKADELLAGLEAAQNRAGLHWDPASRGRIRALFPKEDALDWDAVQSSETYLAALGVLRRHALI
ncbi:MAG: beta-N-acetylhexosaminidase [Candidatus Protistobacter heckmanni]|nr:beta-N-acetylhexosaminidase [Candidatus Protistobacter heckmanni]